jgi:hypothetical protein
MNIFYYIYTFFNEFFETIHPIMKTDSFDEKDWNN